MASGSVRMIFEDIIKEIIEENVVNNIRERNGEDMREKKW